MKYSDMRKLINITAEIKNTVATLSEVLHGKEGEALAEYARLTADAINIITSELTSKQEIPMEYCPDFESWEKNAITIGDLKFAPEDFYLLSGKMPDGKREYFTWHDAKWLEKEVLKPNGWRLPTSKEWKKLCEEYDHNIAELRAKLNLSLKGYISGGDMREYYNTLKAQRYTKGIFGLYWSGTAAANIYGENRAHNLHMFSDELVAVGNNDKDAGLSLRCVRL